MSDPALPRALAGLAFRRADTLRDERDAERLDKVEEFLRNAPGWLPPGRESARGIAAFNREVKQRAEGLRLLADDEVAKRFHAAQRRLKGLPSGWSRPANLVELFACIGEASQRRLGMWPHPVQFAGARLLLCGRLAEMQTGEGKTLVAALAATAMAGSGASVHVISTNDYLAHRDCEEMTPLFEFFGLRGNCVRDGMEPDERRAAYRNEICYVAGKEVVFDYLKDRLAGHGMLPGRVSRLRELWTPDSAQASGAGEPLIPALHFAIVDEADSVLIDEASTPMILSRDAPGIFDDALLEWAMAAARTMVEGEHFRIGKRRDIELLRAALAKAGPVPEGLPAVWRAASWRELLLRQALSALHLYLRDQHYIIAEDKVQIVDESSGRVMADRSWEQGLHQMIETKEGVERTSGRETLTRMTFQRFFRRYFLLAGLTGTGAEASRELWSVYRLPVRRVPPNRTIQRVRLDDVCTADVAAKWLAVADDACAAAARGQPVLVGTRSVEASEEIVAELERRGVEHVVLNARQDADEAAIVAQAGGHGRITVATNMAGRGTDIKPDAEAKEAGGLHVILTEFHESPRVDRQLFGRSGRQGQVGSVRAIVCVDDALFKPLPDWLKAAMRSRQPEVARRALRLAVRWAQRRAERHSYKGRMSTLRQDRELHRLIGFAGWVT